MAPDRLRPNPIRSIVLDTNSLLMPFQFRLNLDLQLEGLVGKARVLVLSSVRDELHGLSEGGNRHARSALRLIERYELVEVQGRGDDAIIAYASANPGTVVVTSDRELRRALAKLGVKRITLYKKRHLDWDE